MESFIPYIILNQSEKKFTFLFYISLDSAPFTFKWIYLEPAQYLFVRELSHPILHSES